MAVLCLSNKADIVKKVMFSLMAKEMGTWGDNCLNVRQHSMCTQVFKVSLSRQATAQKGKILYEKGSMCPTTGTLDTI